MDAGDIDPTSSAAPHDSHSRPAVAQKQGGRKERKSKQYVALELLPNQVTSVHQLASEGGLDELKATLSSFTIPITVIDGSGSSLLHAASHTNQLHVIQYLIENGIDLDTVDRDGNTALHIAVINNHIESLHLLLNSGARSNILNSKMAAPLHIVAQSNNPILMSAILEHSVDFFTPGYRMQSPLHVLAEHDNVEALRVYHSEMVKHKEAFKHLQGGVRDEDDLTPVHLAARCGSHRFLEYVLNLIKTKTEDVNISLDSFISTLDEENSTPLHAAVDRDNLEVVRVLVKYGASPLFTKGEQPSPLHTACSQGKLEMIQAMVEFCGSGILSELDGKDRSTIHYSASSFSHARLIAYLVANGVNPNAQDKCGLAAIHNAIISGNLSAVEELLSCGADPLEKDMKGLNSLHYAVMHNRKAIITHLLSLPCALQLVTEPNSKGESPLHMAVKLGLGDIITSMMTATRPQHLQTTDMNGDNYLHLAAAASNWRALSLLLDIPVCQKLVNVPNKTGETPIHAAAASGSLRCIHILLQHGAVSHKCHAGVTPFQLACSKGHSTCAKALYEAHPFQRDWISDEGNTALHMASMSGDPTTVVMALDIGVKLSLNFNKISFLDVLIEGMESTCMMAVVKHPRWQECLDFRSPIRLHPMVELIVHMPEVAQAVLDRCHTKANLDPQNREYWEKYDFKYLRLQAEHKNDPGSKKEEDDDEAEPLLSHMGQQVIHYKRGSTQGIDPQTLGDPKPMEALQQMVRYNRVGLLSHPIVATYLRQKWKTYGRWVYLSSYIAFIFQVIFLSTFILIANPTENTTAANTNATSQVTLRTSANTIRFITIAMNILNFAWFLSLVLSQRLEVMDFIQYGWLWCHGIACVCTFVFLIPSPPLWVAGSLAAFFAWFRLAWGLQLVDLFGTYITMFLSVTRTVFRVLLFVFFLLAGFALSLFILVNGIPAFSTPGYSALSTLGYLFGELNYETVILESSTVNVHYSTLTFMYLVVMSIVLTVVMANLLIGFAVGDIEQIRFSATVTSREIEVVYFANIDPLMKYIPKVITQHFDKPYCIKYPNVPPSTFAKVWKRFWQILSDGNKSNHMPPNYSNEDVIRELSNIHQELAELRKMMRALQDSQLSEPAAVRLASQPSVSDVSTTLSSQSVS